MPGRYSLPYGIADQPDPNKTQTQWIKYTNMEPQMATCPYCSSEISPDNPALILDALKKTVDKLGGWAIFENDRISYGYPVGKTFTVGSHVAKVEAKKTTYSTGDIERNGYYGESELPQGTTFDVYVIIEVSGSYFKKSGTGDSYGEVSWDGDLKIVKPVEKLVKVFE